MWGRYLVGRTVGVGGELVGAEHVEEVRRPQRVREEHAVDVRVRLVREHTALEAWGEGDTVKGTDVLRGDGANVEADGVLDGLLEILGVLRRGRVELVLEERVAGEVVESIVAGGLDELDEAVVAVLERDDGEGAFVVAGDAVERGLEL